MKTSNLFKKLSYMVGILSLSAFTWVGCEATEDDDDTTDETPDDTQTPVPDKLSFDEITVECDADSGIWTVDVFTKGAVKDSIFFTMDELNGGDDDWVEDQHELEPISSTGDENKPGYEEFWSLEMDIVAYDDYDSADNYNTIFLCSGTDFDFIFSADDKMYSDNLDVTATKEYRPKSN